MKDSPVFIVFFAFFTFATIVVPVPMFPGNMIYTWFGIPAVSYIFYVSAILNGITYGLVAWIVYMLASRKIEKTTSEELAEEEKKTNA
jgi:membrane protein insertase Oxa1/YidC/SpoIIIJ